MIYAFAPTALDADGICAAQTPGAAGDLTIDGALAVAGAVTLGEQAKVTIYSGSNISNRTFTIYGTQRNGVAISEDITGPSTSTVTTTRCFKTITRVAISGAAAGAVTVGNSDSLETAWVFLDPNRPLKSVSVERNNTPSFTYELQWANNVYTSDLPGTLIADESLIVANADGTITAKTANTLLVVTTPVQALRLKITSYATGGGNLVVHEEKG
jgi:hypothetical protein